jgi:hypothetical protein
LEGARSSICCEVPLHIKPYFDEIIKNEDKIDFKRPMELMVEEYSSLSPKQNWTFSDEAQHVFN